MCASKQELHCIQLCVKWIPLKNHQPDTQNTQTSTLHTLQDAFTRTQTTAAKDQNQTCVLVYHVSLVVLTYACTCTDTLTSPMRLPGCLCINRLTTFLNFAWYALYKLTSNGFYKVEGNVYAYTYEIAGTYNERMCVRVCMTRYLCGLCGSMVKCHQPNSASNAPVTCVYIVHIMRCTFDFVSALCVHIMVL